MLFWCATVVRYLLTTFVAIFVALAASFTLLLVVVAPKDDSPAIGIAWFMLAVSLAGLLVPLTLGVTAEIIERKAQGGLFDGRECFSALSLLYPLSSGLFTPGSGSLL